MRDVIVIGAGGGGPVVAKELAARGLDVLMLEAGPRNAEVENDWRHLEHDMNNPSTGYFRWGPADRGRGPWIRDLPQHSFYTQLAGVGGTTQHYFGNSPRAMPGVFRGYSGRDSGRYARQDEFPFSYRSLVPYYEWVEHTLPVQTAAMGTKERVFLEAASKLGLPFQKSKDLTRRSYRPQENAILQPRGTAGRTDDARKLQYPRAQGCTFCGYCYQGCNEPKRAPANLYAKRSTNTSYVPMALTAHRWAKGGKKVTLIADAFATRIGTVDRGGRPEARSVTWRVGATGETVTEEAKVVVMAGGSTENPRLWLNSGLPNGNDQVGRGYTDHYLDWVIGVVPYYTGSSLGAASSARIDYPGHGCLEQVGLPPALQALSWAFSDAGIEDRYRNGYADTPNATGTGRKVGVPLKQAMADVDRLINVLVLTDDDVEPHNRVRLSDNLPPDEHGPVPRVEFRYRERSSRTIQNREYLVQQAIKLLKRAGATEIHRMNFPPLILHSHSTMRMGADPARTVLDKGCEARAVGRLFVADNSALPNSLGGPNPTLTTQALATRTAEVIFRRYFGGDAWVRSESPLSSVDDLVTRAVLAEGL
jgi:choline dehydrogenase-like flavoprotein